jgi:hypothetical protein
MRATLAKPARDVKKLKGWPPDGPDSLRQVVDIFTDLGLLSPPLEEHEGSSGAEEFQ